MILSLKRKLVALDVETSDKSTPEKTRIIELGFKILYPDGREPSKWESYIDPGVPIHKDVTEKHGITDSLMKLCTKCQQPRQDHPLAICLVFAPVPRFEQLAPKLAKGFSDCDFCGYHVNFDLRCLSASFERAEVAWDYRTAKLLDAMHLWRVVQPRTLSDAVREFLHREPRDAHRALGDAEDALDVALAQLERFPKLPRDVERLHDLCFDATFYDAEGKFVWLNGKVVCNFGKHRDKSLAAMPEGYLQWMVDFGDFSGEVKTLVKNALVGKYPTKEVS